MSSRPAGQTTRKAGIQAACPSHFNPGTTLDVDISPMKRKKSRRKYDAPAYDVPRVVLEKMYAAGEWIQLPKDFLYILKGDQAILLAYLVNKARIVKAEQRKKGWFYCKMIEIQKELGFTERKQSRLVKSLLDDHYLKAKMMGQPAKRFFKIDYGQLWESIAFARVEKDWPTAESDDPPEYASG